MATERITLVQEKGSQAGFLLFQPIYAGGAPLATVAQRRRALRGFSLGVFRIGDMMRSAIQGFDTNGIAMKVEDTRAASKNRLLHQSPSWPSRNDGQFVLRRVLQIADRQWAVTFQSEPGYAARHRAWQAWFVLAGGLGWLPLSGPV